ncbi:60S ribosomal subunit assembly/export protein LOC1 [Fulvia fulva]|uniref:60S ribosomal subunit assembly/export protein LOC1 n=1 Tax=Passalora fulva TaxID=5499 RepID=A0A9Q8LA36_PASFU|nr:60S ribosomal subunit assembly/export protein LOC1 [Fulvia fulva]KAK4632184.1 60S ribosomal subunit assembly/export protein LOC1 [Fulvia fulva]KAK4633393.1 60S ribosomal subunit assembly/export protein LOC1 [Fulvia fulva]UJO13572.1 60S ribosomal subunit assembly/export protein LOC1 [Fulvia fulva]WPV11178.1 60S ribosomal subunit assembly/export protein LOC1 [Fulvia fulva]WPV25863.1 60S ribosomal subunit assembly/export protein LOC1 [Fulvia fulva]
MPPKSNPGASKGASKRSNKSSSGSGGAPKPKSKSGPKPPPTQHKPKTGIEKKKKPPHLRYSEKELKVPKLNGIIPTGVEKPPNVKKGKNFVDDKESMNAIMALVMAEKEGNIESKMMRARQMEEVREAKKAEAEKRAQSKKESLEGRKEDIKKGNSKKRRRSDGDAKEERKEAAPGTTKLKKKRVSFG